MRKIEQTKTDMIEIFQKVIYPGYGCAAMIELQIQSLEVLRKGLVAEGANKELNKVLSYEMGKVIDNMQLVKDTLNNTMGEALMGLAPMDFITDYQNKKIGGETK